MSKSQLEKDRSVSRVYDEITGRAWARQTADMDIEEWIAFQREFYSCSAVEARRAEAEAQVAAGVADVRIQSTTRENHMNTTTQQHSESPEQIETRCSNRWDNDEAIRAEFGDYATYLAFEKAFAAGRVKILGGNVRRA